MRYTVISFFLVISFSSMLMAQEHNSSFFDKDYSTSMFEGKEEKISRPDADHKIKPEEQKESDKKKIKKIDKLVKNKSARTEPVLSVGAIISCLNKKHLDDKISELLQVREEKKIELGQFYLMGCKALEGPPAAARKIIGRGGDVFLGGTSWPDKYKVSTSPTWIVDTAEGEHLIEGDSLSKYINAEGEISVPGSSF